MSNNILKEKKGPAAEPFVMETFAASGAGRRKVGDQAVDIERKAYEEGFATGEKAGFDLGRKKAEVIFSGLEGLLAEISTFKETLFTKCEREMVELALAIARKVIQREVSVSGDVVLECVRAALRTAVAGGKVTVRVNPKDVEIITEHREELVKYTEGLKSLVIEGDGAVARGGALIDSNFGEVDATIDGVISEIEERLRDAL